MKIPHWARKLHGSLIKNSSYEFMWKWYLPIPIGVIPIALDITPSNGEIYILCVCFSYILITRTNFNGKLLNTCSVDECFTTMNKVSSWAWYYTEVEHNGSPSPTNAVIPFLIYILDIRVYIFFRWWWSWPQNTLLAIRLYHVIYTVLRTGTQWSGSSRCWKQAVCVKDQTINKFF